MIFVASQADASALNLGKISIKSINDVSQETYDVIAAYGNKSFTDSQIIAIDDFLIQLKNLPTYSRFSYCVLPILAPETPFLTDNSTWTDTNPCYDIINKVRLPPSGYNGYIDTHGLKKGAKYGNPVRIQFAEPLSINPSIFTMGICGSINTLDLGYLMAPNVSGKYIAFGASDKAMNVRCNEAITEGLPVVSIGSRSTTEVHGVMNCTVGVYSESIKEPYAENPYSLKYATSVQYFDNIVNHACSFVFFCKDYMMTEEELLKVNKIFYDLMIALW